MKSNWNCLSCLGGLLLLAGGAMAAIFTAAYFYILYVLGQTFDDGGAHVLSLITSGAIIAIIGFSIMMFQFRRARTWNNVVRMAKTQGEVTVQELAEEVGVSPEKARAILIEAAGEGELSGTIQGDIFTRGQPAVVTRKEESTLVLVICPYCGAKNEQGVPRCHNCDSAL